MTVEEEQREYEKFYIEFLNKTKEIKDDFDKMTKQNQCRFKNDVQNIIVSNGMMNLLYINSNSLIERKTLKKQ